MIKLITAIGPNNLIGKGDKMAWHIPAEFKHFKETTVGHSLFMGGRTFKGLPGKLPGRKHYVMDFDEVKEADVWIETMDDAKALFNKYRNSDEILFIAGGKFIYETFYKEADELIISEVTTDVEGDVFLNMDLTGYKKELIKKDDEFNVYRYTKGEK